MQKSRNQPRVEDDYKRELAEHRGGARNFCLEGSSYNTNIFIKIILYTHINTHAFFYYIHKLFYLISYIYTHPTKKELNIFNQNYV